MKVKTPRVFGISLIALGFAFLFNVISGITGLVILEDITKQISSILGTAAIVIGILMVMVGRKETERDEE